MGDVRFGPRFVCEVLYDRRSVPTRILILLLLLFSERIRRFHSNDSYMYG